MCKLKLSVPCKLITTYANNKLPAKVINFFFIALKSKVRLQSVSLPLSLPPAAKIIYSFQLFENLNPRPHSPGQIRHEAANILWKIVTGHPDVCKQLGNLYKSMTG